MNAAFFFASAGVLLLTGVLANKISSRFNLPTLLLFLAVGALAENWLPFTGAEHAPEINFFGVAAMIFILYSGGLETSWKSVRNVAGRAILLAGPGVVLTALFTGLMAFALAFFINHQSNFAECLLLGALISSTDAAAVFAILRGKKVGLKGSLQPLLEFESGSNDPMAAFLTLLMISFVTGKGGSGCLELLRVVYQLGGGILFGILIGWGGKYLFKIKFDHEGLYFVLSVALVLLCYGMTELASANGFMACYICGLYMNGKQYNYKKGLSKFHNGVAWLMQVGLFTVLGFLANPAKLLSWHVCLTSVILGFGLMFVARPAAVFICLWHSRYTFREKLMISWVGIRGAAPIVLATFPLTMGVPHAEELFRMIFFMVILSILLQGSLLMPVARWLKLDRPSDHERAPAPLELEITEDSRGQEMREFTVAENSPLVGHSLAEIAMPAGALVTMIRRNRELVSPRGNTVVEVGDAMLIMADKALLARLERRYFPQA